MARPDKVAAVAELAENFRAAGGAVLTEYRGLTVKQLQELRRTLGDTVSYAVAKNTLTKIAAKEAGVDIDDALLTGPTAIAFINGDPVEAAKGLRDFAKANTPLVIKGGFLDGKTLSADEISKLADLESREVLLAKLAGAMKGNLQNAASLFGAPLAQTARLVGALEAKLAEEAPAAAPVEDEAPAADAPAEQAAADDTPTEATAEADTAEAPADATTEG
ncbi:ribosomal protein L10 [Aeromicrobium marinum DSM 15272]|uniref:Large ribosomal subunit protein uL10 n=1 Tax=Aeromicrobium marinum DSM 15272 TaxID=585531 RepID=E2SGB8_9ACTN|nr:50S ribosomal protein L10 [Aeromicrobium marinum]EFQ81875.1 ribosomal protein L10 [Aeromicrobium marinum DSM 15272]